MTVAGSISTTAICTLPSSQPMTAAQSPVPTPPATAGGGSGDLGAAIEQVRVAVDQLAQVVAGMSGSGSEAASGVGGGGPTTSGGGGGCGMTRCGSSGTPSSGAAAAPGPRAPESAAPAPPAPAPTSATPGLAQSDAALAARIDEQVLQGTGLAGKGTRIVAASRRYQVPVDFALAIYQKEASFARPGTLADRNNNPGNLRFSDWQKEHGGVPNGGFTKYPTMDDGIDASMHLLSLPLYRDAVARRDWGAIISKYAPSSENDTALYIRQMNEYTANFRSRLGIGEDWIRS